MPVRYNDQVVQPAETDKYLGFWLNTHLKFDTHREKLLAKANSSLEALRAMTGSVWGASLIAIRKAYQVVVVPQMLYDISAW